ncbi:MAG: hypothetical protein GY842_18180 [bacterium]|nr:hypothetical protein [bacterium]
MRLACDAMCGGLARWLRALGADTFYREGVEDQDLVDLALAERRVVITSDSRMLERRVFTTREIESLALPRGLQLAEQVEFVTRKLMLKVHDARCMRCNGVLVRVAREEVGDSVPARSLLWAREFFRCGDCEHVFWDGTHWQRIAKVRARIARMSRLAGEPG